MEFAWLLSGFDIEAGLGGGTTDVVRGVIGRTNAPAVGAYVKFLDPQRLGLEILGNELARALELNAPEAYIVRVPEEVQLLGAPGRSEGFGTVDLEYETISRFMARSPDLRMYAPNLRNVLKGWAEVMVFDEWIGNGGRDFHDALVDEDNKVWVIDHEKSFCGSDTITLEELKTRPFTNVLAERVAQDFSASELHAFKDIVRDFISKVKNLDVHRAVGDSAAIGYLADTEVHAIRVFLAERQSLLKSLLEERLSIEL